MSTSFIINKDMPELAAADLNDQFVAVYNRLREGASELVETPRYDYEVVSTVQQRKRKTRGEIGLMVYRGPDVLLFQEYVNSIEDAERFLNTWNVFQRHLDNDDEVIRSFLGKVEINDRTVDGVNQYLVNQTANLISEGKVA